MQRVSKRSCSYDKSAELHNKKINICKYDMYSLQSDTRY